MSELENNIKPSAYCNYLGKKYPIYATVDESVKKPVMHFDGKNFKCLCPEAGDFDLYEPLKSFYVKASRKYIDKRLRFYQPGFKVKYKSFNIENDNRRWGSCDSKRQLTFHWKLMVFPEHAIDYVIIHEMCHLTHMNHDRSFWRLVGKHCPDYKNAMAVLGTEKTRDM